MLQVLDEAKERGPLTTAQIAELAGVPAQGLANLLASLKRSSKVAEPEDSLWLSADADRFDTSRTS